MFLSLPAPRHTPAEGGRLQEHSAKAGMMVSRGINWHLGLLIGLIYFCWPLRVLVLETLWSHTVFFFSPTLIRYGFWIFDTVKDVTNPFPVCICFSILWTFSLSLCISWWTQLLHFKELEYMSLSFTAAFLMACFSSSFLPWGQGDTLLY